MTKRKIQLFEDFDKTFDMDDVEHIVSLLKNNKDFKALPSPDIISNVVSELFGIEDAKIESSFTELINSKKFIDELKAYVSKPINLGINFGVDGPGSQDIEQMEYIQQVKNDVKKYLRDRNL